MTLASMVQDAVSGLFVPAQARRSVVPYSDLQALNPPTTNPQISPDLLSALAILVAQGPNSPLLLTTDANGRLQVAGTSASSTTFTQAFTGGGTTAHVRDTSSFYPGQFVTLIGAVSGTGACTAVIVNKIPDSQTLVFNSTCNGFNYTVGDFVVGGGDVRVSSVTVPINLGGTITWIPSGGPNPGDTQVGMVSGIRGSKRLSVDPERSCDKVLRSGLTQPAIATIQFAAAGLGNAWVLKWFNAGALNNTAAASTPTLQVWDGPSGTGTVIYDENISIASSTTGVIDRANRNIRGSNNTAMTLAFDRGGANFFEWINAGVVGEGV